MSRLLTLSWRLPAGVRRALKSLPGADRARAWLVDQPRQPGPESGEKRPVVYLPTWLRWDTMRQRPQYLLEAFAAAGHPVYFVDPRERRPREASGIHIVNRLRQVPARGVILYVHFAPLRHLFGMFEDAVVVYDILDDLTIYDQDEEGLPDERRVRAHHPYVLEAADLVLASNPVLADRYRTDELVLVANGVDPDRFSGPAAPPDDLPEGDGPLIGYHGMISHWFDFELFADVARLRPDWRFVLVGPVDPRAAAAAEELSRLGNVSLIGERSSDVMPGYVQAFDVGTVWFETSRMTEGVTPLKMYEYLAAGVPCVSTPLPAAVDEPMVSTAATAGEFVRLIEEALATGAAEEKQRGEAARRHSWTNNLAPALQRLEERGLLRGP